MRPAGRGVVLGALLLTAAAAGQEAVAQEDLELDLFRPRLEITGERVPQREFTDIPGDFFSQRSLDLKLNVPLGSTHFHPGKAILGHQIFAQVQMKSSPTDISFLDRDLDLYSGAARVTGLMLSRTGNLYIASLGASFAEDDQTIDNLDPRFAGVGIGTYRKNEELTFIYGGIVSYAYGRRLTIPMFGLVWRYRPKWSLFTVVPFVVKTTYRRSDKLSLNFNLAVSGDRHRFANEGDFPGEPETIFLRVVQSRLGAELEYRPNRDHAFLGEVGVLSNRRLEFSRTSEIDDTILEADIEPSGYLRLAWRYSFGKSLLDKAGEAKP